MWNSWLIGVVIITANAAGDAPQKSEEDFAYPPHTRICFSAMSSFPRVEGETLRAVSDVDKDGAKGCGISIWFKNAAALEAFEASRRAATEAPDSIEFEDKDGVKRTLPLLLSVGESCEH